MSHTSLTFILTLSHLLLPMLLAIFNSKSLQLRSCMFTNSKMIGAFILVYFLNQVSCFNIERKITPNGARFTQTSKKGIDVCCSLTQPHNFSKKPRQSDFYLQLMNKLSFEEESTEPFILSRKRRNREKTKLASSTKDESSTSSRGKVFKGDEQKPLYWKLSSDEVFVKAKKLIQRNSNNTEDTFDVHHNAQLEFTVHGKPVPLRRHRTSRGFVYNPSAPAQKYFREVVKSILKLKHEVYTFFQEAMNLVFRQRT